MKACRATGGIAILAFNLRDQMEVGDQPWAPAALSPGLESPVPIE